MSVLFPIADADVNDAALAAAATDPMPGPRNVAAALARVPADARRTIAHAASLYVNTTGGRLSSAVTMYAELYLTFGDNQFADADLQREHDRIAVEREFRRAYRGPGVVLVDHDRTVRVDTALDVR